jgi:MFS family permease
LYRYTEKEEDLGAWVGTAGAAISVGQFLSSFFWGLAADKFGRRPVMLLGMFNSTFSVLVFGSARSYTQCVAGRVAVTPLPGVRC